MPPAEPEPPLVIIRAICAQHSVRSHTVLGAATRSDVVKVRHLCIKAIAAAHPDLPMADLADLFAIQVRRVLDILGRPGPLFVSPRAEWTESPEAILRRRVDALGPGFREALLNGRRTRPIANERWSIICEIDDRCPGIHPGEIATLFGVDRTSVRHCLQKRGLPYAKLG